MRRVRSPTVVVVVLFSTACSGDGSVSTGELENRDGGATGATTGVGGSAGGATSAGGSIGNGGAIGSGGAPGIACLTNLDCPQTNCVGCAQLICVNGLCVSGPFPGAGGVPGVGGMANTGGLTGAGATIASGGTPGAGGSTGAGGALPSCGMASHVPQCEEYTRHTCSLCDPGGCNESQLCYALTSCDSLYPTCPAHFGCALSATTCAEFQSCARCQL